MVAYTLSGRIQTEDLTELERVLGLEPVGRSIVFDLREITLVDRDAVKFLAGCEKTNIKLENCPPYIREWMDTEKRTREEA